MSKILQLILKINHLKNKLKILISYIFRSFKNYFKLFFNSKLSNYFLPNLVIKNVILIDPNKIKFVNSIPMKFYKNTQLVFDFDWDKENQIITEYRDPAYITCKELFIEDMKLEECKEYFHFKKKIHENKEWKNCKNENDIIQYLKKKIKLFEGIKKIGVKKNFLSNIEFMIDKNGNLVKINSGNHRFMISRILELKKIPIEIKVIHLNNFNTGLNQKIKIKDINNLIKVIANKYA